MDGSASYSLSHSDYRPLYSEDSEAMSKDNFELRVEAGAPLERELWLINSPDYETLADRLQRVLIVASRPETDSVTAKTIQRGFYLTATNVDELPQWLAPLSPITLQLDNSLAAVSSTRDYSNLAADPEGMAWELKTGTLPQGLTVAQGTGNQSKQITYTYPSPASNPSANLSFTIPLSIEQPTGTPVALSGINQIVRVFRYAPRGLSTSNSFFSSPGRLYIIAGAVNFGVSDSRGFDVERLIENHDSRPILADFGTDGEVSMSTSAATYTLIQHSGEWYFQGTRQSNFPFSTTQVDRVTLRFRTNDNGDTSTIRQYYQINVEV